MSDRERGPLEYLEVEQLRPFPPRPSFGTIVADALEAFRGADDRLGLAAADLSAGGGDPNDGFAAELGAATADGLEAPGGEMPGAIVTAIGSGDDNDTLRASVQDVLPPVEAPIDMSFDEPPSPPNVSAGRDPTDDKAGDGEQVFS